MQSHNVYFEHIHRMQRALSDAKDIQGVLTALDRLRVLQQVWSDVASHLKLSVQNSVDPSIEEEIIHDIEALCAQFDGLKRELGEVGIVRPSAKKQEPAPAEKPAKKKAKPEPQPEPPGS